MNYGNKKCNNRIFKTLYRLEREDLGERICIINKETAIDIEDFNNKYEIIKRDQNNRVLNNIDVFAIYAFDMEPVDKKTVKNYKKRIKQYKKLNH